MNITIYGWSTNRNKEIEKRRSKTSGDGQYL